MVSRCPPADPTNRRTPHAHKRNAAVRTSIVSRSHLNSHEWFAAFFFGVHVAGREKERKFVNLKAFDFCL